MQAIDAAGARKSDEYIMLSDEVSPWKCNHYISLDKEVPGADLTYLSGIYLAKVFEGPFQNAPDWHKEDFCLRAGKMPRTDLAKQQRGSERP